MAGGALVGGLGAPAGWLSGAMLGVAALAAAGGAAPLPKPVQRLTVLLAGVGMGSGLTPATLHTLIRYPLSLALLAVADRGDDRRVLPVLMRADGFNRQTAFYSAVPGALSYVFLVAARTKADLARVAVIQVFRIFVLMAIVPLIARFGVGAASVRIVADPVAITAALLAARCSVEGLALERRRGRRTGCSMPGSPFRLAAHGVGGARAAFRRGCRSWRKRWSAPGWAHASSASTGGCCASWRSRRRPRSSPRSPTASAFAGLVAGLTGVPFAEALAAFSPGGLEAMTMMAFALGMDPLFVGAHHIARFLFISLALPWVARRIV